MAGRPKGSSNRENILFKEAVTNLLNHGAPKMLGWLDEIAQIDGPYKAMDMMSKFAEFAAPKLARVEHAGDPDAPVKIDATLSPDQAYLQMIGKR